MSSPCPAPILVAKLYGFFRLENKFKIDLTENLYKEKKYQHNNKI